MIYSPLIYILLAGQMDTLSILTTAVYHTPGGQAWLILLMITIVIVDLGTMVRTLQMSNILFCKYFHFIFLWTLHLEWISDVFGIYHGNSPSGRISSEGRIKDG